MTIYTGFTATVNGIMDEKIRVSFNSHDGLIGLEFWDDGQCFKTTLSYAAAPELINVLQLAVDVRRTPKKVSK